MPRLKGRRSTCAPASAAIPAVRSVEPSSTTTMSKPGSKAWISSMTRPTVSSSFSAGTIAMRRSSPIRMSTAVRGGTGTCASSATGGHGGLQAHELEDLPRTVRVGVLVEHALASAASHSLGRRWIVEQLAICGEGFLGIRDDAQLRADVEPTLDALVWVGHDRRAGGRQLERPARGGRIDGRMGAARDVEVDPGPRDRLSEDVERHIADHARGPDIVNDAGST